MAVSVIRELLRRARLQTNTCAALTGSTTDRNHRLRVGPPEFRPQLAGHSREQHCDLQADRKMDAPPSIAHRLIKRPRR